MEIKQKPSKNFSSRQGRKIIAIVDHITAGAFSGAVSWLSNPAAKASAHYIISRAGEIVQLVADENKAWHAGGPNKPNWPVYDGTDPNLYTIGIEHEGYKDQGGNGQLTEDQYQATLWLHRQLIAKHGIKIDRDHIIGHYRIDSVNRPNCPGPAFPWDRLFDDLDNKPVSQVPGPFPDVAGDRWSAGHIARVKDLGLMVGGGDGYFNPEAPLTREQMAALICKLIDKGML